VKQTGPELTTDAVATLQYADEFDKYRLTSEYRLTKEESFAKPRMTMVFNARLRVSICEYH
jgi:hypothetical protein